MFEKNLQDLVKGIRSTKSDPSIYISQSIQEIKNELKSTDHFIKAEAVKKLTYLYMMGYDMAWAAFHVVEVMSYERFSHKRSGYLAASQSFTHSTDVVLLCTNLLKKEFGSLNEFEVGIAINCLSNITTKDLSRDLLGDVVSMMSSARPYVRKKAVLVLYKLFLQYPQGLRLTFDRLKERMEEDDVSVVSCAVNVICELANKNPKNYLGLAPTFFRLLTTSSNNWMLIKVVKLMSSLVPEEPRLARKLLDPLATVIQNTPAKSLLYECISTVTTCLMYTRKSDGGQPRNVPSVVRLCNDHLRRYIQDPDQNLRYLGLVGLQNLMKSHPFVVTEHQEIILECLSCDDITIRLRALDLVSGMTDPDNTPTIVKNLVHHAKKSDGTYREELIGRILEICCKDKYHNVEDFDWYIHVLVELAHLQGESHGRRIAFQLVDIAIRVETVRSTAVNCMIPLLSDVSVLSSQGSSTIAEVLYAAAWIVGEFAAYVGESPDSSDDEEVSSLNKQFLDIVDDMLQPRTATFPSHVQAVYIQSIMKLLAAAANSFEGDERDQVCEDISSIVIERLPAFIQSEFVEVQERACCLKQILINLGLGVSALSSEERTAVVFDRQDVESEKTELGSILASFFSEQLSPVNPKAQSRVPIPKGLDLDIPMDTVATDFLVYGFEELDVSKKASFLPSYGRHSTEGGFYGEDDYLKEYNVESSNFSEDDRLSSETLDKSQELEKVGPKVDPFYLSSKREKKLDSPVKASKKKSKKKSRKRHTVNTEEIMPQGMLVIEETDSNNHMKKSQQNEYTDLEDVDLTVPLSVDETMPVQHLYHRSSENASKKKKKSKSKKKHKIGDTPDNLSASKSQKNVFEKSGIREKDKRSDKRRKSSKRKKESGNLKKPDEPLLLL